MDRQLEKLMDYTVLAGSLKIDDWGSSGSRYKSKKIPISRINVLTQPRKTFPPESIECLALDIFKKGLIHAPTVLFLSEEKCQRHLEIVNEMWGTDYTLGNLKHVRKGSKKFFYILLAGERRFKALSLLFKKEMIKDEVSASVGEEDPVPALARQLSENIHEPVPPHEEAKAFANLFKVLRKVNPDITITAFAKNVGKSPDAVRNAVRFCELPERIQEQVEEGVASYGIAVELWRLWQSEKDEEALVMWMLGAVVGRKSVADFRKFVTEYLKAKKGGQQELFLENNNGLSRHRKKIVERDLVLYLWSLTHYFKKVLDLFESGLLGEEESPFSEKSPLRKFNAVIKLQTELIPHIEGLISTGRSEEALQQVGLFENTVKSMLGDNLGDGNESSN